MLYIGIDIGTTTISGLLIDAADGSEITRKTIQNTAHIPTDKPWKSLQSPDRILKICYLLVDELAQGREPSVAGIGLTGQMHGILYVDREGMACSQLVSWQDERGNTAFQGTKTYCQKIKELTGCCVATGFGLTTMFYDAVNGLVPKEATGVCTIADYVAMRLTGQKTPLVHASNAASMGLFSLDTMSFEENKIKALGVDTALLPMVTTDECVIGRTKAGLAVAIPIGDNQASFLGAVGSGTDTLINIGTGSQISRLSDVKFNVDGLECRPYIDHKFLLAGASLCGGSSYNLLVKLFADVVQRFASAEPKDLIKKMDQAAAETLEKGISPLRVDTRFRGTRDDSEIRGAVYNIGINNLTAGNLCYSFLRGVCEELKGFYKKMTTDCEPDFYAISGNAARNSEILRKVAKDVFSGDVRVPQNAEEAAFGAALLSVRTVENRAWSDITRMIRYQ